MLFERVKGFVSIILSLSMLLSVTVMAAEAQESVGASESEYVNNEIFVMYEDGTSDILKYENAAALAKGLEEMISIGIEEVFRYLKQFR